MAAIITRETNAAVSDAAGITNNNAVLTNTQLDQNFINLNNELAQKLPVAGGTITGDVTLSTETAEGVLYLDTSRIIQGGANLKFNGTGLLSVGTTGTARGAVKLAGSTSGYVELQAPTSSTNITFTLPGSDGLNGQVLSTNGVGSLSWINQSAGSGGGGTGSGSSTNRLAFTATAAQTTFNVSYVVGQIDVYMNGSKLVIGTDVVADTGTSIVLSKAASAGDIIDTVVYSTQWNSAASNIYFNTGNVGVGNTNPAARLHVSSAATALAVGTVRIDGADSAGTVNAPVTLNAVTDGVVAGGGSQFYVETRIPGGALTEKFRIDGVGNVTLNTGTAGGVLYLNGSKVATTGSALTFDGVTNKLGFQNAAANGYAYIQNVGAGTNTDLAFFMGATEQMRLNSSGLEAKGKLLVGYSDFSGLPTNGAAFAGSVGIGTSSPISRLQSVDGDITVTTSSSFVGFNSTRAFTPSGVGQQLGRLHFSAYSTGTTYVQGASIQAFSSAAWSSTSAPSYLSFQTTASGSTSLTERMVLDASGNLGIGVTPSAWGSTQRALQIRNAVFWNYNDLENVYVGSNYYFDGTNRKYIINGYASEYSQGSGTHAWYNAPSGTAGVQAVTATQNGLSYTITTVGTTDFTLIGAASNTVGTTFIKTGNTAVGTGTVTQAIQFNQAMTLDTSGNLGIGTASPLSRLDVRRPEASAAYVIPTNTTLNDSTAVVARFSYGIDNADITAGAGIGIGISATPNRGEAFIVHTHPTIGKDSGDLAFWTTSGAVASEKVRITAGGNVGIGVTLSPWLFGGNLQIAGNLSFNAGFTIGSNVYYGASSVFRYINDGVVTLYQQTSGQHLWFTSNIAGTAGAQISNFSQSLTLQATGDLSLGTTSTLARLAVVGTAANGYTTVFASNTSAYRDLGGYSNGDLGNGTWNWEPVTVPGSGVAQFYSRFRSRSGGGTTQHNVVIDGDLGVGTPSPQRRLGIGGTANAYMNFNPTAQRQFTVGSDSNGFIVYDDAAPGYRMVIDASGNLGIGTTSPTQRFEVLFNETTANRTNPVNVAAITATSTSANGAPYGGFGPALVFRSQSYNGIVYNGPRIRMVIGDDSINTTTGASLAFDVTPTKGAAPTQAAIIDPSGNLGIGTTPEAKVHANFAGVSFIASDIAMTASQVNIGVSVLTAGRPFIGTNTSTNPLEFGTRANTETIFVTNSVERARLNAGGGFFIRRGDNAFEGGEVQLARANDDAFAWAIDVYGSNNTGANNLRFVNAITSTNAMMLDELGRLYLGTDVASGGRATISATANYGGLETGYSLVLANTTGTGASTNNINVGVIQFGNPTLENSSMGRISVVQENPSASTASTMRFFTNNGEGNAGVQERARITSAGTLLIGSTTPRFTNLLGQGTVQFERSDYSALQLFSNVSGVDGSYIALWKARGNALNSVTSVVAEDIAGGVYYGGYNGTDAQPCAAILANIDATPSSTSMPGRLVFQTTAVGSNTPQERARITSGGNFFVGSQTGGTYRAWFENTGASNGVAWRDTAVSGSTAVGFDSRFTQAAATSFLHFQGVSAGSTVVFQVYGNGNVANTNNSYGAISDIKLKENISDASPKLDDLMQVRVVNYNLKSQPDQKHIGVIAQELEQVFPGMVEESPDRDAEGNDLGTITKAVKYSVFVPMLIKALQEQQDLINSLTSTQSDLLSRIQALEA